MTRRRGDGGGTTAALRRTAAVVALTALLGLVAAPAGAEPWRSITIGESNTEAQWDELLAYFGATPEEVDATVTVADTQAAMEGIFDVTGIDSAYSSTSLICRAPGSGVQVTTRNIEVVTPDLYALALVTAGVEDAELVVAAPDDAPALGMTALTGVFATLESAPCGSAAKDPARQQLAMEGLALAAGMGQGVADEDGVPRTADALLETQRAVVSERLVDPSAIDAVVAEQEAATGIAFPSDERSQLIDLMARLSESELNWGSFAQGWTVSRNPDANRITMVGAGPVAAGVGGMSQADAAPTVETLPTAPPEEADTTASPAAAEASPPASPVATPAAASSPEASPLAAAVRRVTDARPPTSPGLPPATGPKPVEIAGTLVERDGPRFVVRETGGDRPVAYNAAATTDVLRSGRPAAASDLLPDDRVRLTVDPQSARLLRIEAEPAPAAPAQSSDERGWVKGLGWVAALGLIGAAAVLFARRRALPWLAGRGAGGTRPVFTRGASSATIVQTAPTPMVAEQGATAHGGEVAFQRRRTWLFGRGR